MIRKYSLRTDVTTAKSLGKGIHFSAKEQNMNGAARPKFNGKGMIWQGDKTSHGGLVMTGLQQSTWNGITGQARLNDIVFCPKCDPHRHSISQASGMSVFGVRSALEGDMTSCGAVLLAERADAKELEAAAAFMNGTGFDDRYVLLDAGGQPMPDTYYACQKVSGEIEYGTTDSKGQTKLHLTGVQAEQINFFIAG